MSNGTLGDGVAAELVDGSGTVIVGGQVSYNDYSGSGNNQPFGGCGNYTAASTSKTFQLYGAVVGGGSTGTFAVSSFSVTSLANGGNVASNSTGQEHIERATVSQTGSSCSIVSQSGSWLAVAYVATGHCTLTFTTGEFSSTPSCVASSLGDDSALVTVGGNTLTKTGGDLYAVQSTNGSLINENMAVVCMGPH
jgi:hypothetical protein